jgi:hypothetical protein
MAFGVTAFAQSSGQSAGSGQTSPSSQSMAASSSDQQVTLTGCVQRESDYRSAKDKGRGGAAGTGVGVGNEFILTDASLSSAGSSTSAGESTATGTSGSSKAGSDYELTGSNEGQVGEFVGKRVEITGKLKSAETDASGRPTGGATAGAPPSGVDVASKDLKLRELEVSSVREATGSCSPMK